MGKMPDVAVHGVRLVLRRDGDAVLLGILDLSRTGVEIPLTPRSDQRDVRSQCLDRQLEADLVIALARSAVSDSVCALLLGNLDELLGDDRTCKRRARRYLSS